MLIKTLSHKWGKLNLPTLLFKVGLLTLINMDSLIYLDRLMVVYPLLCTGNPLIQTVPTVDSHNNLSAKFSVLNTLSHRAKTVCSNPELFKTEKEHLRKALTQCKYPKWALDKVEKRINRPSSEASDGANSQGTTSTSAATKEVKE